MALIRHVVGLFVFFKVLDRFVFGVGPEKSRFLNALEDGIFSQRCLVHLEILMILDSQLEYILASRQAMGKAASHFVQSDKERIPICEDEATDSLVLLLREILPASGERRIRDFVTRILKWSVDLRTTMTIEKAIYRFFMVDSDSPFDPEMMEASGAAGTVLLCVFPGLKRLAVDDRNVQRFICVRKASVKLTDAFIEPSEITVEDESD
jgi:hypothetical protein